MTTPPQDTDLIIARSTDGGVSFPVEDVLHLVGGGIPSGAQIYIALAVDRSPPKPGFPGGLNVFWYNRAIGGEDDAQFGPFYLRIPEFSGISPPHSYPHNFTTFTTGLEALNDYYAIVAGNCHAWTFYVAPGPNGRHSVYVGPVTALCPADSDDNGGVDSGDAALFLGRFLVSDARADRNHNGQVEITDVEQYLEEYACRCGVP